MPLSSDVHAVLDELPHFREATDETPRVVTARAMR